MNIRGCAPIEGMVVGGGFCVHVLAPSGLFFQLGQRSLKMDSITVQSVSKVT